MKINMNNKKKIFVGIILLFLILTNSVSAFTDVGGHWGEEFINWASEKGIVSGYPDDTFKPQGNIKNVEFYKMINQMKGLKETSEIKADIDSNAWYYPEIQKAVAKGYISAEGLDPMGLISRDEVARIVAYVYGIKGDAYLLKFNDNDKIKNKEAVASLVEKDIIKGDDKGNFNPNAPITRAEASKILSAAYKTLEKKDLLQGVNSDDLIILHTNDVHGRVVSDGKYIGYANYKNVIDEIKSKHKRVLVIDAGDASQGTNFASLNEGKDVIDVMNNLGVDAFTPGNHEFDYSKESALLNHKNSNFKWYASNVFDEATNELVFEKGEILDLDGVKVGVFGMATPETKYKADPRNTQGMKFVDSVEENSKIAQAEADRLRSEGANIVVMISHLGDDKASIVKSTDMAKNVKGVDVIVDGHSHTLHEKGLKTGNSFIVSTGDSLKNIGMAVISPNGGANAHMITKEMATPYGEDEKIKSQIEKLTNEQDKVLKVVIGKTKTDLDGERANVRTKETNLGNLITDAMKHSSGADVVITNGGGIRASIPKGNITVGNVFEVLPFGNAMTVIEVKGQDIVDALNHGAKDYPNPQGSFPHVAGLSFEIIEGTPSKVSNVLVDGKKIDLNKTYTLATNDFMAVGGDGYTMFEGKKQVALYGSLADLVKDYIEKLSKENPEGIEYNTEDRIKVSFIYNKVA